MKLTTEKFIERSKIVHGNKYDYSQTEYKSAHEKVKIICPTHGVFEQKAWGHLNGKGCPECARKKPWTTETFVKKAKEIHGDKYDYSKTHINGILNKVIITCPIHGDFEQIAQSHINGHGCKKCLSCKETFIKKAKEIHGDKYDYSLVDYKKARTKIKIICPIHGIFEQQPRAHLYGQGCAKCKTSRGENVINEWFKNNFDIKKVIREFKFSDCKDIKPLPFDFYIPSKNLLIEYQGEQHYRRTDAYWGGKEGLKKQRHHDWIKRKFAKDKGIELLVIPYWNFNKINDILNDKFHSNRAKALTFIGREDLI